MTTIRLAVAELSMAEAEAATGPPAHRPIDPSLDLVPQARTLAPVFPLEERGTGLVLHAGASGEMQIHWRLERDDFERAAASFPQSGGRPMAVIRLRRDRSQGGAEQVDEIPLGLGVHSGGGERSVGVPADHGRYHAELGLSSAEGGWLMLARSNGLYNAVGVGLHLEALPRDTSGHGAPQVSSPRTVTEVVRPGLRASEPGTASVAVSVGVAAEPALTEEIGSGMAPAFPLVIQSSPRGASAGAIAGPRDTEGGAFTPSRGLNGVAMEQGGAEEAALPAAVSPASIASVPVNGKALVHGSSGVSPTPSESVPTQIGVPLTPLTYESPPQQVNGLQLEAELRVTGRARPGSTIDLFGFRYRVGSGGRFQLLLPVTDPELLRRALEAAPPPELTQNRDD